MKLIPVTQPRGVILEKNGEPHKSGEWVIQSYLKVDDREAETIYEHCKHPKKSDKWFKLVDND